MAGSIKLSPKHGVNPSLMQCFYCGEASGVALLGQIPGDAEAPRQAVYDMEPCATCKGWMAKGVILISVKDGSDHHNPYRTGGWAVVTEDAFRRMFNGEIVSKVLECRWAFVPDQVWDAVGLPRG